MLLGACLRLDRTEAGARLPVQDTGVRFPHDGARRHGAGAAGIWGVSYCALNHLRKSIGMQLPEISFVIQINMMLSFQISLQIMSTLSYCE